MRIQNSIKNMYVSIITQIVIIILGFLSRMVFINSLGTEYLGVNGLLTSILSMLSLVEGGIGTSIVYNLYKPLAENDTNKVIALVQLYKKLYGILAIVIFILSTVMYVALGRFIKGGTTVPFIGVVYFIFVVKNVISYLNAHKWSLINADQKGYIIAKYNLIFNIITTLTKIVILKLTKNYILYLLIDLGIFMLQNIYNGKIVSDRYEYINTKDNYHVDEDTKKNLVTNVKAIFLHNIGGYCVFGTDNLLISTFININTVGLYSNYTMVISQLASLLTPLLNGMGNSIGNLIATECKEKIYEIFNVMYLINFWIYSFCAISLYNLLEPFIDWCFGRGLLLDKLTLIVILINFYISGLRNSIGTFKQKAGIYDKDKYQPLIESAINLVASIILVKYWGLSGIFMGTTISSILIPLRIQPKIVFKDVFNKPVKAYFKKYVYYIFLTIIAGIVTTNICNLIDIANDFMSLVVKGIVCVSIPNIIYLIIFYRSSEFKYILSIILKIAKVTKPKSVTL
ncbi:lipopolysaccharide biosynthesis protein [Romboutsia sp. 1001713B170207_170306_H8]|uniref:lipopolysaccharide biosynthesis protein n=1 Tax=Romboutsia sp. 1001713B170207_170306_H8 TaxID=2787112 RepID=UPI000821D1F0|nr:hypothetical protein [Romboutsia sp. 1001713B170207_170306_H8]SCH19907.1 Polysaccharide biosynthesis protein [uncultured Clostridium sp.]